MPAGAKPTETNARERETRRKREQENHVAADGELRGPELPDDALPDGEEWHPRTVAWWNTWRESAQAQTFTPTDWDSLIETALLHHAMWAHGKLGYAAEIRLRVTKFGATPEDRMRLKLRVDSPAEDTPDVPDAGRTDTARRRDGLRIVG